MSTAHIIEFILDKYTMYDLIEKLEPYITMEDFIDALQPLIDEHLHSAFAEELEDFYLD